MALLGPVFAGVIAVRIRPRRAFHPHVKANFCGLPRAGQKVCHGLHRPQFLQQPVIVKPVAGRMVQDIGRADIGIAPLLEPQRRVFRRPRLDLHIVQRGRPLGHGAGQEAFFFQRSVIIEKVRHPALTMVVRLPDHHQLAPRRPRHRPGRADRAEPVAKPVLRVDVEPLRLAGHHLGRCGGKGRMRGRGQGLADPVCRRRCRHLMAFGQMMQPVFIQVHAHHRGPPMTAHIMRGRILHMAQMRIVRNIGGLREHAGQTLGPLRPRPAQHQKPPRAVSHPGQPCARLGQHVLLRFKSLAAHVHHQCAGHGHRGGAGPGQRKFHHQGRDRRKPVRREHQLEHLFGHCEGAHTHLPGDQLISRQLPRSPGDMGGHLMQGAADAAQGQGAILPRCHAIGPHWLVRGPARHDRGDEPVGADLEHGLVIEIAPGVLPFDAAPTEARHILVIEVAHRAGGDILPGHAVLHQPFVKVIIIPAIGGDIFVEPGHPHQGVGVEVKEPVDELLSGPGIAPVPGNESTLFQRILLEIPGVQHDIGVAFQDLVEPGQPEAHVEGIRQDPARLVIDPCDADARVGNARAGQIMRHLHARGPVHDDDLGDLRVRQPGRDGADQVAVAVHAGRHQAHARRTL